MPGWVRGWSPRRSRAPPPARGAGARLAIEIGAGYGATFPFYPSAVSGVLALEPDPRSVRWPSPPPAGRRARHGEGRRGGSAAGGGASADVVVSSLVLCSVPDPSLALAEVVRVLRPGGLLLFYEHVRSAHRLLGAAEDLLTPLWGRLAGGCHPTVTPPPRSPRQA